MSGKNHLLPQQTSTLHSHSPAFQGNLPVKLIFSIPFSCTNMLKVKKHNQLAGAVRAD
jgi:hypothetical protein